MTPGVSVVKKLQHGESNPGLLRDRQRCYQLHHVGLMVAKRFGELVFNHDGLGIGDGKKGAIRESNPGPLLP